MPQQATNVKGNDLPIVKLVPRQKREITTREYMRMTASIRAVGLIEPLVVFPENGHYVILDGYQRYKILLEMGVERVPCLIWSEKEAFTGKTVNLTRNANDHFLEPSIE